MKVSQRTTWASWQTIVRLTRNRLQGIIQLYMYLLTSTVHIVIDVLKKTRQLGSIRMSYSSSII